jgi:hypothetical protein
MGTLYTNNFRGRAGRTERAKHLVREFENIEAAFTRLQALNIATYLTIYTNTTSLSGVVTISPDNGFLQELTLTGDASIQLANPLNESQYRVSLLIHGGNYKIVNLWGAQTWKEYGLGNWWELYTGEGPYASALLDFYWDICSHTWICVASTKNQFNLLAGGTEQRLYPLLCDLANTAGDDTLTLARASMGMTIDDHQHYHYLSANLPRYHGVRWVENWVATASDLTTVEWVDTDCTVTTDAGAGPAGEDVQRLSFDTTGGKLAKFILPSFGRASRDADEIKVAVSFKGKGVSGTASVRVYASVAGKTNLSSPVHDQDQITLTGSWATYSAILSVAKSGNDEDALTLDDEYPKTLIEIAFVSPSGSAGSAIQITDVQVEVLRANHEEVAHAIQDTSIGASMVLSATGTGTWVDATKTMTLATVSQSVDFGANLEIGKTYLVHARLQSGDAADVRMQNELTVWAAGLPSDDLYLQDAPFTFQYDGGVLKFVLMDGSSAVYLVDIYEVSGNRNAYCTDSSAEPISSGILLGTAREIEAENLITYPFFRTFRSWDMVGMSGVDANDCRNPVFQSEYGIDGWPARGTILQGASKVSDGFIQREITIPQTVETYDMTFWVRRTFDVEGNQIVTPQHNDVTVPISRYVDFEADLTGGTSSIGGGRTRLDLVDGSFVKEEGYGYTLGIFEWNEWYMVVIQLTNDGLHDTFRIRVHPASADVADPATVDVTQQGWAIIDWAQFEVAAGTYIGSSPVIGGETRVDEDFGSALPDGYFYRISDMQQVATLTGGSLTWTDDDGVYKNLLYSTTTMIPDIVPKNMHEFGLVEAESQPTPELTLATTTPYPIEAIESMQLDTVLAEGSMSPVPEDELDLSFSILQAPLNQILLSTGPHEDEVDLAFSLVQAPLYQILLSTGPHEDALDLSASLLQAPLEDKLVTALAPDEELQLDCVLSDSDCSMTPI